MRLRLCTVAFVLGFAAAAAHAQANAPPSAQQMFDAGQAQMDARQFVDAESTFAALETRLTGSAHPQARSIAVARLRRAQAYSHLGEDTRAGELLLTALPALDQRADGELRAEALHGLGEIEERALDFTAAAGHYRDALALLASDDSAQRVAMRLRIARTAMFDDPAKVAADLEAGLPEATKVLASSKPALSQYLDFYGRALLNAQQIKAARAPLRQAVALTGGLTLKVSIETLEIRGDAAIAAEFDHDDGSAATFLSYTGAGQSDQVSLRLPPEVDPPACGDTIRPDDVAVVQFSLADDGTVSMAQPIYASRPGQMAIEFARAVQQWRWSPAAAQAIKPFFRLAARLEMRCTTRADKIPSEKLMLPDVRAWLGEESIPDPAIERHGPQWIASLRKAIAGAERDHASDARPSISLLAVLAEQPEIDRVEQHALLERAGQLAAAANAPLAVRAVLSVRQANTAGGGEGYSRARHRAAALSVLANEPDYRSDPRVAGWLKVLAAEQIAENHRLIEARTLLESVVATPETGLSDDDPIRRAAAIRLASLQTATGSRDKAAVTFAKSGLNPNQCALLDEEPLVKSRSASFTDYPDIARRLGFEGWAVTEFDVTNAGRTANPRALIAYPPFLFGSASTGIVRRSVYQPTFRPDGALSCGGYRDRVLFKQPQG